MQNLDNLVKEAIASFCPFGYLDMETAVRTCTEAGKDTDFIYDSVVEFSKICDVPISDCDPVGIVYEELTQEARNEIIEICDFDIQNDASFEVSCNYMATRFDVSDEDEVALKSALIEAEADEDDFSDVLKWFLSENDISLSE